jgi:hypothetical protein
MEENSADGGKIRMGPGHKDINGGLMDLKEYLQFI